METINYDLSADFSLEKANPEDWGIYYSVYYNLAFIGFFKEGGHDDYDRDNCYWIRQNNLKIGGVIMSANLLTKLFFIPPFKNELRVVKLIKKLLIGQSDGIKDINVACVLPHQVDLFSMAGFWSEPNRSRWMKRPTEEFDVAWDQALRIEIPEVNNGRLVKEREIAELLFESFKGGINAFRRNHSSADSFIFIGSPDFLLHASTLVYDKQTNHLVAVCLIFLCGLTHADKRILPGVFNIGVLPAFRNRGLAANMLKQALSSSKKEYPILRVGYLQGTYAESVYHDLGFMSAEVEVDRMYLPVSEYNPSAE